MKHGGGVAMTDAMQVDIDTLVDIRDISVNTELSKEERIFDFIRKIKNPYLCRYGDIIVECVFADEEYTLSDRLKQHFRMV